MVKNKLNLSIYGFTLAEVLITLGIIGIVAALTIPTLIKTYEKQTVITSLQKFNSTMHQAIKASEAENGQIQTWNFPATDWGGAPANLTVDFLNTYILPYLRVARRCDLATTTECWNNVLRPDGVSTTVLRYTNAAIAKYAMQDGTEIVFLSYIAADGTGVIQVLVDINGAKQPNTLGKDVFVFIIAQKASNNLNGGNGDMASQVKNGGFYPDGYGINLSGGNYNFRGCGKNVNYTYAGSYCAAKIINDGWQIKSDYPFFN